MKLDRSETSTNELPDGERGSAAIEFAFVAPVLIALIFGTVEITNLLQQNRKVSLACQTMIDMVSRMKTVTASDRADIANAVDLILRPYNATYSASIAYVAYSGANPPAVSNANSFQFPVKGGYVFPAPDLATNTAGLSVGNDAVIVGRVSSAYVPILVVGFMGTGLQLDAINTERPRQPSITYKP